MEKQDILLLKKYLSQGKKMRETYLNRCKKCGCTEHGLIKDHSCKKFLTSRIIQIESEISRYMKYEDVDILVSSLRPGQLEAILDLIKLCERYRERLRIIDLEDFTEYEKI